jgi:hypothetical protein
LYRQINGNPIGNDWMSVTRATAIYAHEESKSAFVDLENPAVPFDISDGEDSAVFEEVSESESVIPGSSVIEHIEEKLDVLKIQIIPNASVNQELPSGEHHYYFRQKFSGI